MSWGLCTKADVVSLSHVSEAALEDFWSDAVEALIRRHLGMPYLGASQSVSDEYYSGDGTNILIVRKPPILSVTSLSISDYVLPATDYVVTDYSVQLKYTTFPRGTLNVKLTYESGVEVADVDPIIRLTAAAMITAIYNYRERGGADASIKWATAADQEGEENPNQKIGLTSHLEKIMRRMLRRERLRVR